MTKLDHALKHIRNGTAVFRVKDDDSKEPFAKGWQAEATLVESEAIALWTCPKSGRLLDFNIGLLMTENLIAVDIDVKHEGENGFESIEAFEAQGCIFAPTFTQYTPTGGQHWIYRVPSALKSACKPNGIAPGIDIKGCGSYVLGAGSVTTKGIYTCNRW